MKVEAEISEASERAGEMKPKLSAQSELVGEHVCLCNFNELLECGRKTEKHKSHRGSILSSQGQQRVQSQPPQPSALIIN